MVKKTFPQVWALDTCEPGKNTIFLLLQQTREISGLHTIARLTLLWSALLSHSTPLPVYTNLWCHNHSSKGEQVKLAARATCYHLVSCWESNSSVLVCKGIPITSYLLHHEKSVEKVHLLIAVAIVVYSHTELPFKWKQWANFMQY